MLFPVLAGVAVGLAVHSFFFDDEALGGCQKEDIKEETKKIYKENYDDDPKISFMDSINLLKRSHPLISSRQGAAKVFMIIFENGYWDEDNPVTRIHCEDTFDKCKEFAEKYCGIRNLKYTEGILFGGEIDETCPVKPKFMLEEGPCPTAEELVCRYPELKVLLKKERIRQHK